MHNKKWKFGIGIGIILAVVAWEGFFAFKENKMYYVTVNELTQAQASRRMCGWVVSSRKESLSTAAASSASGLPRMPKFPVTYVETIPLPDTFKDGAQAIVDGDYLANGEFRADKIQAKCASKYSAAPGSKGASMKGPVAALSGAK